MNGDEFNSDQQYLQDKRRWASKPPRRSVKLKCPLGLEYFLNIDGIFIKQQIELAEMFSGYETCNRYEIINPDGERIFYAIEISTPLQLSCCGNERKFYMKILDQNSTEVMRLIRPCRCNCCCYACCCPCCLQEINVYAPPETKIGSIRQICSVKKERINVYDSDSQLQLFITGPRCCTRCMPQVEFDVNSIEQTDQVIGRVSRMWQGLLQSKMTDADIYGITFPVDLSVTTKALLMAACLLLDYMYFEVSGSPEPPTLAELQKIAHATAQQSTIQSTVTKQPTR